VVSGGAARLPKAPRLRHEHHQRHRTQISGPSLGRSRFFANSRSGAAQQAARRKTELCAKLEDAAFADAVYYPSFSGRMFFAAA
jgi:hypothetical protein